MTNEAYTKKYVKLNSDTQMSRYAIHKSRNGGSRKTVNIEKAGGELVRWVYLNTEGYRVVVHKEYLDEYGYNVTDDERLSKTSERIHILNNKCSIYANTKNKSLLDSDLTREDVEWCLEQDTARGTQTGYRLTKGFIQAGKEWPLDFLDPAATFLEEYIKKEETDRSDLNSVLGFFRECAKVDAEAVHANTDLLHEVFEESTKALIRGKVGRIFLEFPDGMRNEWQKTNVSVDRLREDHVRSDSNTGDVDVHHQDEDFYIVGKLIGEEDTVVSCDPIQPSVTAVDLDEYESRRVSYGVIDHEGAVTPVSELGEITACEMENIDPSRLVDDLQTGDRSEQHVALRGMYKTAQENPEAIEEYTSALLSRLSESHLRLGTLNVCEEVSSERSDFLVEQYTEFFEYISPLYPDSVREAAVATIYHITKKHGIEKEHVTDEFVANLEASLQDNIRLGQVHSILSSTGKVDTEAIIPLTRTVLSDLNVEYPEQSASALVGFMYLIPKMPDLLDGVVDTCVELLAVSERDFVRANTTAALVDIAGTEVGIISEVLPKVLDEMDEILDEDHITQSNVPQMLHYVAEEDKQKGELGAEILVELLDSENQKAKFRAIKALAEMKYTPARSRIQEVKKETEDEQIKNIADWAAHKLG